MKVRAIKLLFFALNILCFAAYAQNKALPEIFLDNFKKATLEVKLEVVKDAIDLKIQGVDSLFSTALRYCIDNLKTEGKSATLIEIMQLSINEVRERKYKAAVPDLLSLFQTEIGTEYRIQIVDTITDLAPEDENVLKTFNRYLAMQNESYRKAKIYEKEIVPAVIRDLGKMGSATSFSPILIAVILKYSNEINAIAEEALADLFGELKPKYLNFILEEQFPDKLAALKRALSDTKLSMEDKSSIAEFALNVSIHTAVIAPDNKTFATEIRNVSLSFLSENHWSHAADVLIDNFNLAVDDYDKKLAGKTLVLKAIDALGNMRSHEAAKRLVLYLEFINSFTERGKAYDEEIVLHVIAALKQLGDIVAQEVLLYSRYINYSDKVRQEAFAAFQSLK
jgi:hypothetical protein